MALCTSLLHARVVPEIVWEFRTNLGIRERPSHDPEHLLLENVREHDEQRGHDSEERKRACRGDCFRRLVLFQQKSEVGTQKSENG